MVSRRTRKDKRNVEVGWGGLPFGKAAYLDRKLIKGGRRLCFHGFICVMFRGPMFVFVDTFKDVTIFCV
jgi:hypothetical protein